MNEVTAFDLGISRRVGANKMESALLQNLMAGAGSTSQFIGGLVVALLYAVIGLLSAIGSILIFRQIFQGRWEQIFWTSFLVVIAAFYLSFAAYFGASIHAWQTEIVGVAVFLVCALRSEERRVGKECRARWSLEC